MRSTGVRDNLLLFLSEIQATKLSHSGRQLSDHLLGTFDLLQTWGCTYSVCIAGGLHSVYGTSIYDTSALGARDRLKVRNRFDITSERLAWLFGSLDRPEAIEKGSGLNRRTNKMVTIEKTDLDALRLIEAANLLEQGDTLRQWPNISKVYRAQIGKRK